LRYQWRLNRSTIEAATNSSFTIDLALPSQSGNYSVVVYNEAGATVSSNAVVNVLIPATITSHPISQTVTPHSTATFNVQATSSSTISYQWRKDGVEISGATSSSYEINGVSVADRGMYDALVTDAVGTIASNPARLEVLIPPTVLSPVPPLNLSITPGTDQTLSISVDPDATLPVYYRWRRGFSTLFLDHNDGSGLGVFRLMSHSHTVTIPNLQPSGSFNSHLITVVLSNSAFFPTLFDAHTNTFLTFLPDMDGDGMDDAWETANGLNPNDPADALLNADGDGVDNLGEYQSGTDPQDDTSFLKVDDINVGSGVNVVFQGVLGRSYSILYKDSLDEVEWQKLTDVVPTQDGLISVNDPSGSPTRYYKLVLPRQE
jgi:hypothetical protein